MLVLVIVNESRHYELAGWTPPAFAVWGQARLDREVFKGFMKFHALSKTQIIECIAMCPTAEAMEKSFGLVNREGGSFLVVERA